MDKKVDTFTALIEKIQTPTTWILIAKIPFYSALLLTASIFLSILITILLPSSIFDFSLIYTSAPTGSMISILITGLVSFALILAVRGKIYNHLSSLSAEEKEILNEAIKKQAQWITIDREGNNYPAPSPAMTSLIYKGIVKKFSTFGTAIYIIDDTTWTRINKKTHLVASNHS